LTDQIRNENSVRKRASYSNLCKLDRYNIANDAKYKISKANSSWNLSSDGASKEVPIPA
jgi:hypothetical protein